MVERLAADIQKGFPGMAGFSPQNIWKMRAFYLAWTAEVRNLSQLAREIDGEHLPSVAAEIPWGHNMVLIFKLKDPVQRLWYGHQAPANGWSRSMLEHWIESDLYSRQGEAVTNFSNALPPPQSCRRASHLYAPPMGAVPDIGGIEPRIQVVRCYPKYWLD